MIIYSKTEERFLKYIGYHPSVEESVTWKAIRYSALQSFAPFFVKLDHVYERGLDVEELGLALSGDADQAWEAAEPYYTYARLHGHAEAAYRCAKREEELFGPGEFVYPMYLEKAVKLGHEQAIRDFFNNYDAIKAKTITKDVWRRKRRQERLYFQCCRKLASQGDTRALWKLGTCYMFGTGVKKDAAKGLVIRDRALKQWELDGEDLERFTEIQDSFKQDALDESLSFGQSFLKMLGGLFSFKKKKDRRDDANDSL